jgi:hypothetical protein
MKAGGPNSSQAVVRLDDLPAGVFVAGVAGAELAWWRVVMA